MFKVFLWVCLLSVSVVAISPVPVSVPTAERAVMNLTLHDPCRREVEAHALSSPSQEALSSPQSQEEELTISTPIVFQVPSGTYAELTIGAISGCTVDIGAGVTVLGLALVAAPTHGGRLAIDGPHLGRVWVKDADSELVKTDEKRPTNRRTGASGSHHPVVIITNVIFAAVTSGMDPIIRLSVMNGTVSLSHFTIDMKVKLPAGARGMIATPPRAQPDHDSSGSDDHESSSGGSEDGKADVAAMRIDASNYNATVILSNVSISVSISTSVSAARSPDLVGAAPTMFHGVLAEGGSLSYHGGDATHATVLHLQDCRIKVTADRDARVGHSPLTAIGVAASSIVASNTVTSVDVGGAPDRTEGLELNGELHGGAKLSQRNAMGVSITKARTQRLSLADVSVDVTAPGNATAVHVHVERSLAMSISGGAFIAKTDTTSPFKKRRTIGTAKGSNSTAIGILVAARIAPERSCFPPSTVTIKPDLIHASNAAIATGMLFTGEFQGSWLITFASKSLQVSGRQTAVGVHVMSFTPSVTARPLPVLLPPRCNQLHNTSMRASFTDVDVSSSNGEAIGVVCWKGPTVYGKCLVFPGANMSVIAAKKAIGLAIYGAITILERGALQVTSAEGVAVGAMMAPAPPTAGLVTIYGAITVTAPTAIGVCSIGSVLIDGGVVNVTATNAGVAYGALVGNQGLGITVHNGEVHASHDASSHSSVVERPSSSQPLWSRISFAAHIPAMENDLDDFKSLTDDTGPTLIQATVDRFSSMRGLVFERHTSRLRASSELSPENAASVVAPGEVMAVRMGTLLITYLFTAVLTVTTFAPAAPRTIAVAAITSDPKAAGSGFIRTSNTVVRVSVLPPPRVPGHGSDGMPPSKMLPPLPHAATWPMTQSRTPMAVTASGFKFNGTRASLQARIIGGSFEFHLPPRSKATGFDASGAISTDGVLIALDAAFNDTSHQFEPVQLRLSNSFNASTLASPSAVFDAALTDYPKEIAGSVWIHAHVPPTARLLRSTITCVVPPCPATIVNEESKSRIEEFRNHTKRFNHRQWSLPIYSAQYDSRFGPLGGPSPRPVTKKIGEGLTSLLGVDPGFVFVWVPSKRSKSERLLDRARGATSEEPTAVSLVVVGSASVVAYDTWVRNPTDTSRAAFHKTTGLSEVTVIEGGPPHVASPPSHRNVAAIVGGVSAAVVGVAVCSVIVFWFLRRRRRSRSFPQETDLGSVNPYVRAEALLDEE